MHVDWDVCLLCVLRARVCVGDGGGGEGVMLHV